VKSDSIYVAFPRTTSAYNHKGFGLFEPEDPLGYRESGTFLKMMAVALHAKRMHFDTMYLLPSVCTVIGSRKGLWGLRML